jgi:hypothetical protein
MSLVNEANGDMSHDEIQRALRRYVSDQGAAAAVEVQLPNGCVADLAYHLSNGAVHIVEVKAVAKPYFLSAAYSKYAAYCNYLWCAFPADLPLLDAFAPRLLTWPERETAVGVITVTWHNVTILRSAAIRPVMHICTAATRAAIDLALTAGEQTPALKTAAGAERPNNTRAAPKDGP